MVIIVVIATASMSPTAHAAGPVIVEADPFSVTAAAGLAPGQIELATVSTRPSVVTGGDVRMEVRGLGATDTLQVERNGADVTSSFAHDQRRPATWTGVVSGLALGSNDLVATASGQHGVRTTSLTVVNHPISGPIISGPHQQPFRCETVESGMGGNLDADCFAPTMVDWYARDILGTFTRLANPYAPYPLLTATTTVRGGARVPFVVRVESSVINRSITRVAVLDDPRSRGPNVAYRPAAGWNNRLVYSFGGDCGNGYHQGSNQARDLLPIVDPVNDLAGLLGRGYMTALSSLTTFGVACNQLLSAETLMMVKEHIVEAYGRVDHTIGTGTSGGAIQQYTIADQYPGLIDAGTPTFSFPDIATTLMSPHDCMVLTHVFDHDVLNWDPLAQGAVAGFATPTVCRSWNIAYSAILRAGAKCDPSVPAGTRCSVQETYALVYGRDPATGHARGFVDNVGVQYGLRALQQGQISPGKFIALNRTVGGLDADGNPVAQRSAIDPDVARRAYEYGFFTGRGGLSLIPMIDLSIPVIDFVPLVDIHDQVRPFEVRARLAAAGMPAGTQAIWSGAPLPSDAIAVADHWLDQLDALLAASPGLPRAEAVARARPATAGDQCRVAGLGIPELCDEGLLRHGTPRQVAGAPLAEDYIKCQLRPIDATEYPATVTAADLDQIRAAFPEGVCDYSRPPVGFTPTSRTWLSYGGASPTEVPYPIARSAA